ncbi:MAG: sodium-coupled permease [Planctomycetota bacterium]|jgi:SSS family solute:Na+ symporter|nr:sodium-coupled permease [Planctomycetota bacterium]MDP7129019.1 sodium-coupled permease [Planctomycetota bacterium]
MNQETLIGLHWIDWILIAVYALSTIGLGVYFGRKQKSTKEYFVGGGNMNPFFVGVSLFATLLSTISYLSMPGESAGKGPVNLLGMLALPFVFWIVAYGLLPVYMKNRVTSAYELLEERLGVSLRLLGATMFLALRLVWMTLLVYLAAKAMIVMMGVEEKWVPLIVLITGIVSVIYTSLGGLRAVIITDFMQTVLLFGGALLVIITVTWSLDGFSWFPTGWQEHWDTQPFFSFDPKTRVTVVGTILSVLTWYVATSGGDQTSVQRFMATTDASSARRALATQLCVGAVVGVTLYTVGFALLGYFKANLDKLPEGMSIQQDADKLFPHYIAYHLPIGVSGLVVSAMFAAAMSSIDSGVNSITAVVLTDFLDRFGKAPKTEEGHVRFARFLAFGIGLVVVLGSTSMKFIPGNITGMTNRTVNLLTTPIFGLFFFALFVPFARPVGVWLGTILGTITAACISFSGPLVAFLANHGVDPATFNVELITKVDKVTGTQWVTAEAPISFQWIGPAALLVNIAVGTGVSWLLSRRERT